MYHVKINWFYLAHLPLHIFVVKIIYKPSLLATLEDTIFWLTSVSLKCTRSPEIAILGTVIPVDLYPIFSPWFSLASVKCSILYMYRRLLLPSTCRNHVVVVFIYLTHFFSTMSSKFITVVPQSNCGNAQASQLLGEYGLPMSFRVESLISTKYIFKTISIKWILKIQIIFRAGWELSQKISSHTSMRTWVYSQTHVKNLMCYIFEAHY